MMYANVFKGAPLGNKNAAGKHHHKGQHTDSIPRSPTEQKRHEKDLESDNWHTKTMAAFRDKSNDSLKFIRQDASEAAVAMRDVNPKKEGQYLDEAHYASMELNKRKTHFAKQKSTTKDDTMKQTDGWAGDLGVVQKKCDPKKKEPMAKKQEPVKHRDLAKTDGWGGMFGV